MINAIGTDDCDRLDLVLLIQGSTDSLDETSLLTDKLVLDVLFLASLFVFPHVIASFLMAIVSALQTRNIATIFVEINLHCCNFRVQVAFTQNISVSESLSFIRSEADLIEFQQM